MLIVSNKVVTLAKTHDQGLSVTFIIATEETETYKNHRMFIKKHDSFS